MVLDLDFLVIKYRLANQGFPSWLAPVQVNLETRQRPIFNVFGLSFHVVWNEAAFSHLATM